MVSLAAYMKYFTVQRLWKVHKLPMENSQGKVPQFNIPHYRQHANTEHPLQSSSQEYSIKNNIPVFT